MQLISELIPVALLLVDLIVLILILWEIWRLRKTDLVVEKNIEVVKESVETISKSVALLERDRIYFHLSRTAEEATECVHHLSVAQSSSELSDLGESERVKRFLTALHTAVKKGREVQVLGPDLSGKIGGLWERRRCGCKVKVHPDVAPYDARIQVVDRKKVVVGIGPPIGESQHGFLIESATLAMIAEKDFARLWESEKAKWLDEHIAEVVCRLVNPCLSSEMLASCMRRWLNVADDLMVLEIISMLQENNCLCEEKEWIYNVRSISQHHKDGKIQLRVPELREYLSAYNPIITDSALEKIINTIQVLK